MKYLKNKWAKWVIALVLVCVLIVIGLYRYDIVGDKSNNIQVIYLNGTILESGSDRVDITPSYVREKLEEAKDVGAVVLRVSSPGGSVVASQEILDTIRYFKSETGMPIVFSMGELAASGGYYIALGADKIIADPGTLTGSIGVITQFMYIDKLYEKLGIETEIIKSGKYKALGSSPLSDEEKIIMQELCDNIYDQFVREVSNSRKIDIETVKSLATGQVYSGEQALNLGLIDEVGEFSDAINLAAKLGNLTNYKIVDVSQSSGAFSDLFASIDKIKAIISTKTGMRVMWLAQ